MRLAYEYMTLEGDLGAYLPDFKVYERDIAHVDDKRINEAGALGWEVVSVHHEYERERGDSRRLSVLFKRVKD